MSEINNSHGADFYEKLPQSEQGQQKSILPEGVTFKGEKTDLRYDPRASVNKAFVDKIIKTKVGEYDVKFGSKEIKQVKKDLEQLNKNTAAVQKASALFPYFQGKAKAKGFANPDAAALAVENYAATVEFVKNNV